MSMPQHAITAVYSVVTASGMLRNPMGRRAYTGLYFWYKKYLEDPFHQLTRSNPELFQGGHIVDVGANVGYTAWVFARAITPGFHVFAFEPESLNFRMLNETVARLGAADTVIRVQAAVGAEDGHAILQLNPKHPGDHRVLAGTLGSLEGSKESVAIVKIDSFLQSKGAMSPVRFIKIDVQGYEMAVCQGMGMTLEANPGAAVCLEYSPDGMKALGFDPSDLLHWFEERGYKSHVVDGRGRLHREMPARLGRNGYLNLLFER